MKKKILIIILFVTLILACGCESKKININIYEFCDNESNLDYNIEYKTLNKEYFDINAKKEVVLNVNSKSFATKSFS